MEELEDRRMLAIFTVSNVNDSGTGSLRDAITMANNMPGSDTINFALALSGQTITLGGSELAITEAVTIAATLPQNVTIDAQQNSRIFNITATTGDVTIAQLTLTGGRVGEDGGAIRSSTLGKLTIDHSTISYNTSVYGRGGGVFSSGDITLTGSIVSGNRTQGGSRTYGGGIYSAGAVTLNGSTVHGNSTTTGYHANGGGIFAHGDVTLIGSTVSGNSSGTQLYYGGGGGIFSWGAVTLTDSTVSGNSSTGAFYGGGGGIYSGDNVTLTDSTVSGNISGRDGGGIYASGNVTLTDSTVSGNSTAGSHADGGGISSYGIFAAVTVTNSIVNGNNSAGRGGGIYSAGYLTLIGSTVSGNSTAGRQGGGIASREVSLIGSTVSENSTVGDHASGGGIFSGNITLSGSTVSENSTTGDDAEGGGIFSRGNVTLTDSTVSGNSTTGEQAYGGGIRSLGSVALSGSTVSGNSTAGFAAFGGGIFLSDGGSVALTGSTISGNSTTGDQARGGGIFSYGRPVALSGSTVSGNSTAGLFAYGGGIFSFAGAVTLRQSTVTNNQAHDLGATGGGIWNNDPPMEITNSIIAGNSAGGGMNDIDPGTGSLNVNFSLIEDTTGLSVTGSGNIIGRANLGPLADNGGSTQTHALLAGSPAIDAGDPGAMAGVGGVPEFDQRGAPYGRVEDGDDDMSARIDMGAFEVQPTGPVCDFDGLDGCDIKDIDALIMEIVAGTNNSLFDLTADGLVDLQDRDQWLADAGALNLISGNPYLVGDANLDGVVDGQDFIIWNENRFTSTGKWSLADWNADGITDGQDFIIWNGNRFQSSDGMLQIVSAGAKAGDTHETRYEQVESEAEAIVSGPNVSPQLVPLMAKRVDSVFAMSRRGEAHNDASPHAISFANLGDALAINPYLF